MDAAARATPRACASRRSDLLFAAAAIAGRQSAASSGFEPEPHAGSRYGERLPSIGEQPLGLVRDNLLRRGVAVFERCGVNFPCRLFSHVQCSRLRVGHSGCLALSADREAELRRCRPAVSAASDRWRAGGGSRSRRLARLEARLEPGKLQAVGAHLVRRDRDRGRSQTGLPGADGG